VPEWPTWDWADYEILNVLRAWIEDLKACNCTPHLRGLTLQLSWVDPDTVGQGPPYRVDECMELGSHAGLSLQFTLMEDET
jgi:hypothetical protein